MSITVRRRASVCGIDVKAIGGALVSLILLVPAFVASEAQTYTVLHAFSGFFGGTTDGANPSAGLIQDSSGNLYGTAPGGGRFKGVVFKLDTTGKETVLHEFGFAAPPDDGANPSASLVRDAAGNLFGTTVNGGDSGLGVVFEFTATHFEAVLHSFAGHPTDGAHPYSELTRDGAGNFYGTTYNGGASDDGVVFKLATNGKETVLYSFHGPDGANPSAGLWRDQAGNLYGTTVNGGAGTCSGGHGCGVVFKLATTGKQTVLYSFHGPDGANPMAGLWRDAAGNLYGTTYYGGSSACFCGVIFKLDTTGKETVLYSFAGGADGGNPSAGLIRDAAGNLYGTTTYGNSDNGVVFKLDSSGMETVLHSFIAGGSDGVNPTARLLLDAGGNFYGTTSYGGDFGVGVLFKLTP